MKWGTTTQKEKIIIKFEGNQQIPTFHGILGN